MRESFEAVMPSLLRHEGGYVDDPQDPGGATNLGITLTTLSAWRGRPASKAELRALTQREAEAIYRARYWQPVRGDELPAGIDYCVFDAAVHSGPARAARFLQAACRVRQDGVIGPVTIAAARARPAAALVGDCCDLRLAFLRALPTWSRFGRGWSSRIGEVRRMALAMTAGGAPEAAPIPPQPAGKVGIGAMLLAFLRRLLTGAPA